MERHTGISKYEEPHCKEVVELQKIPHRSITARNVPEIVTRNYTAECFFELERTGAIDDEKIAKQQLDRERLQKPVLKGGCGVPVLVLLILIIFSQARKRITGYTGSSSCHFTPKLSDAGYLW